MPAPITMLESSQKPTRQAPVVPEGGNLANRSKWATGPPISAVLEQWYQNVLELLPHTVLENCYTGPYREAQNGKSR